MQLRKLIITYILLYNRQDIARHFNIMANNNGGALVSIHPNLGNPEPDPL